MRPDLLFRPVLEFPRHNPARLFSTAIETVSVLGTVHHHRQRWNPFDPSNRLLPSGEADCWIRWFTLHPRGGRHGDGIYTLRFVINHNPRRSLKLKQWQTQPAVAAEGAPAGSWLQASLHQDPLGRGAANLSIRVHKSCALSVKVDPVSGTAWLSSDVPDALSPVHADTSYELNGFVWDDLDAFGKFDERRPGRSFQRVSDELWEIAVLLRHNGGIDFRQDGIYQFLISRNGDEDQGLAALNADLPQESLELVEGSGFGSSHGTCRHSAPTIQVSDDGLHVFSLRRGADGYRLWVRGPGGSPVPFCNQRAATVQLLGTVHAADSFDPTQPQAAMQADASGRWFHSRLDLKPGTHAINFAIGQELFLDTMGLGCWLEHDGPGLRGIGWHGKPNESNIVFEVHRGGLYEFRYDRSSDLFCIDPVTVGSAADLPPLTAVGGIESLSLVGNFPAPLVSWSTEAEQNLMADLGGHRYEKLVHLEAGETYQFKIVANRSNWLLVFADYELDGFGMAYDAPQNPNPFDSSLADLKHHGQLTTHGNPPAISVVPNVTGLHRFCVDLNSGAYAILPLTA